MSILAVAKTAASKGAVKLAQHSPAILTYTGVISLVGGGIIACRQTIKAQEVLPQHISDLELVKEALEKSPEKYTQEDALKDRVKIATRITIDMAKLYWPSILLAGAGVFLIFKGHNILSKRNIALSGALTATEQVFKEYRKRVAAEIGEARENELRYPVEMEERSVTDVETGETKTVMAAKFNPNDISVYARKFTRDNKNYSPQWDNNMLFLKSQQNFANDLLRSRGHLFLNEVYDSLGLSHTSIGALVGWVYDPENGEGDNYVDFGLLRGDLQDAAAEMLDEAGAILLDFNVDGVIWNLI